MLSKTQNLVAVLLFIISLAIPTGAFAQVESIDTYCSKHELDKNTFAAIPRLAALSQVIIGKFCAGELPSTKHLSNALLALLIETDDEFKSIGISESIFPFQSKVTKAIEAIEKDEPISNMAKWPDPTQAGLRFYGDAQVTDKDACDRASLKALNDGKTGVKTCIELLSSYQAIYSHAQILVQKQYTIPVKKYLQLSQKQWDDFFSKSRSQTSLELTLNSYLWQKNKVAGMYLSPPEMQWIVLHPSVVMEHVPKALSGSRTKEGVMVEILGVNWWEREKWYQLSGASIVSLYSDRAITPVLGHGVALHFGNNLTFGAVKHGESNGFFVSLDVLELYKDKRAMMDSFTGALSK